MKNFQSNNEAAQRIAQASAVFDILEQTPQGKPPSVMVEALVNQVCHDQQLSYSADQVSQAMEEGTALAPAVAESAKPNTHVAPSVMAWLGAGAIGLGALTLAMGSPIYASFITTIRSWIGGCILLSHRRQVAPPPPSIPEDPVVSAAREAERQAMMAHFLKRETEIMEMRRQQPPPNPDRFHREGIITIKRHGRIVYLAGPR